MDNDARIRGHAPLMGYFARKQRLKICTILCIGAEGEVQAQPGAEALQHPLHEPRHGEHGGQVTLAVLRIFVE